MLFFVLPFLAVIMLSSCTTQDYVARFSNFVDKTDATCQYYSFKQWERNVKTFKKYSVDRFYKRKANLSIGQIKDILALDARYLGIVSAQGVIDTKDIIKEVRSTGPEVAGSFLDSFLDRIKSKR